MKKGLKFMATTLGAAGASAAGYCATVARRPEEDKLHVAVDLDATILQSFPIESYDNLNHSNVRRHDHAIPRYFIWHRPFAHWSLWFLNQLFVVHLFTAATQDYGEGCVESFPGMFGNKRLYRESVTQKDSHGKDLRLITDDPAKIVLVDDQKRNRTEDQGFYHIPPYTRFNDMDFELPKFCAWTVCWQVTYDLKKRNLIQ